MYKGKCLVAHPKLQGSLFNQSVVYVYQENKDIGAYGIILNKPSTWNLDYVFDYKGYEYPTDEPCYVGGPVSTTSISLLHSDEFYSANTVPISNGVSISSDNFMFEKIYENNAPANWRLFVGISGWAPMQLDKEVNIDQSWLLVEPTKDLLFNYSGAAQYHKAIELYSKSMTETYFPA